MIHSSTNAPYRWRWLAFAAVLAASVMDLMDSTIAGVAAPTIRHDLRGSYADLQWITAGYRLAMAVVLLIGGRLGDLFGRPLGAEVHSPRRGCRVHAHLAGVRLVAVPGDADRGSGRPGRVRRSWARSWPGSSSARTCWGPGG
jgi:hypothetical protein